MEKIRKISLLTLALIIPVMASTASANGYLWAGQNIKIGNVWTSIEGSDPDTVLAVEYELSDDAIADGWSITETHLHVAAILDPQNPTEGIPQTKKGNPKPGKFDYKMIHGPGTSSYLYEVYLYDGEGNLKWPVETLLCIAAHAVVQQVDERGCVVREETAWGDRFCNPPSTNNFPGNSWATYFIFLLPSVIP